MSTTPSPQTHTTESSIPVRKIFLAAYPAMAVWSLWYLAFIRLTTRGPLALLHTIQDARFVLFFAVVFVLVSTIFALVAWFFLSLRCIPMRRRMLFFCLAASFWYVPFAILSYISGTPFMWQHLAAFLEAFLVFLPAPLAFLFFLRLMAKSERN